MFTYTFLYLGRPGTWSFFEWMDRQKSNPNRLLPPKTNPTIWRFGRFFSFSKGHVIFFQGSHTTLRTPMFLVQCYFQGGYHQNLGVLPFYFLAEESIQYTIAYGRNYKYGPDKKHQNKPKNTAHNIICSMYGMNYKYLPTFYHQRKRHSCR